MSHIAVLAWGSLKWDRRQLVVRGGWRDDGPTLQLEFSRRSFDGRLTLVIDQADGEACRSGWWESGLTNMDAAIVNLADREGSGSIGSIDLESSTDQDSKRQAGDSIREWLRKVGLDAVIWTDLKPNFREKCGYQFSVEAAMSYLRQLEGQTRSLAWEYLERAPVAVQTPLRRRLIAEGWIQMRSH